MNVTTSLSTVNLMRYAFQLLSALSMESYKYATDTSCANNTEYDFIIVGCGSSGGLISYRLSEDTNVTVLCIEAGEDPQWQAQYAGIFPYLTNSTMDWKYTSKKNNYTAQYHRNQYLDLPSGKSLGGSSVLHHFYYIRGIPTDYDPWVTVTGDSSWSHKSMLQYYKKSERLEDAAILSSDSADFHGTDGLMAVTRQLSNLTTKYLEARAEVGDTVCDDLNTNLTSCYTQPMFSISSGGTRQSSAECFLAKAKERTNLNLMKGTMVTKVLFDEYLNATGVQCIRPDGTYLNVSAKKEVILAAGAIGTPKVLMASGLGPKAFLESLGISVLYDSPVGQTYKDHMAIVLPQVLGDCNDTTQAQNPSLFPVPSFVGVQSINVSGSDVSFLTLNLICRNSPATILLLASSIFGLHDDVSNQIAAAGDGKEVLFTVLTVGRPFSNGSVQLRSADPADTPIVDTGFLTDKRDIQNAVAAVKDYLKVNESSYYKKVGGGLLKLDLPNCDSYEFLSDEYLECYIFNMMDTTFHYCCSTPMGTVVNSDLQFIGTNKLSVGDASIMPGLVSANINAAVVSNAEKAATLIKKRNTST